MFKTNYDLATAEYTNLDELLDRFEPTIIKFINQVLEKESVEREQTC